VQFGKRVRIQLGNLQLAFEGRGFEL